MNHVRIISQETLTIEIKCKTNVFQNSFTHPKDGSKNGDCHGFFISVSILDRSGNVCEIILNQFSFLGYRLTYAKTGEPTEGKVRKIDKSREIKFRSPFD